MRERETIILGKDLLYQIDKYRGYLKRSEFVSECIETTMAEIKRICQEAEPEIDRENEEVTPPELREYVTYKEFEEFKKSMYQIQDEYTDFIIRYGQLLLEGPLPEEKTRQIKAELQRLLEL